MNNLDKRILIQVAHKEAVDWALHNEKTDAEVEETAQVFYEQLVALIEKYGAAEADAQSSGKSSKSEGTTRSPDQDAPTIEIDGVEYKDFRGLKALPGTDLDPNYPDFKVGSKGYWLTKKDGSPTKFAIDNGLTVSS